MVYTVGFWLWIDSGRSYWRNILTFGEDLGSKDRNPGIYVYPDNTARIHFRQNSTRNKNDGQDLYNNPPGFRSWFHFAAVVNDNTIQLYLNGSPREQLTLPGNNKFAWSSATALKKNLNLNIYRKMGSRGNDGEMYLAHLMWANRALSASEIGKLARDTDL